MANKDPNTLLLDGLSEKNKETVRNALDNEADVNYRCAEGGRPLHIAVKNDSKDIVKLLIKFAANVYQENHLFEEFINAQDEEGFTPLMAAALNGRNEIVHHLLEKGSDFSITMPNGDTALHLAMESNDFETVTTLLDGGADFIARNQDDGSTPLHYAAEFDNRLAGEALLRHPNSPVGLTSERNAEGKTPSEEAVSQEFAHRLDLWAAPQKDVDREMIQAIMNSNLDELEEALKGGADVNLLTPRGDQPLHAASLRGSVPVIQLLLRKGASVDSSDGEGYVPLMVAALNGHLGVVEVLINYGTNVNQPRSSGKETALHFAIVHDHSSVVRLLLDQGANVNSKDSKGRTPLHYAAQYNAVTSAKELLKEYGCLKNEEDQSGRTPIYIATKKKNHQVLHLLGIDDPSELEDDETDQDLQEEDSLLLKVIYGDEKQPSSNVYKNISKPRGHVLVINYNYFKKQNTRHGSEQDIKNLAELFKIMGYKIQVEEDLSYEETKSTLEKFSQDEALAQVDSAFVFMLSHGENKDTFLTSDDEKITVTQVQEFFKDSKCPHLKGKPKVFVFNFCRGTAWESRSYNRYNMPKDPPKSSITFDKQENKDNEHLPTDHQNKEPETSTTENTSIEVLKNVLTVHASTDGIKALRDGFKGTYFIMTFCLVLAQSAHNTHMVDLVGKICSKMEKQCFTTPACENIDFRKYFYLNPLDLGNQ